MFLVVAIDRNWAISTDNSLVYRIPVIKAQFREHIRGKIVVYNRKTLESFPGGQPLDGCRNLIYTRDMSYICDGATIIHSIEELDAFPSDELYVIGGANAYRLLYKKCKYAYVAYVDSVSVGCNAFFPDLSQKSNWNIIDQTAFLQFNGLSYKLITYTNNAVD